LVWTGTPDDRRRPLALRSFASFECLKVREEYPWRNKVCIGFRA